MAVMAWEEHARRSLFVSRLVPGCRHVLSWMEPVRDEPMYRLHCSECGGDAWVNLHPAGQQGADPDDVVSYVEKMINEQVKASQEGGRARGGQAAQLHGPCGAGCAPEGRC